jgi:imidazolonepropionase-like amidohydrolase
MYDQDVVPNARFVDTHVHIRENKGFEAVIAAGVGAVRDAGTKNAASLGLGRRGDRQGMPAIRSAGWALYKKGGYGSSFGIPVEGREEILKEIRKLKTAGADIIKVVASGMVSLKTRGTITPGGFNRQDLLLLVQAARSEGLKIMAHANGEQAIIASAESGVRSIEHGFFMTKKALDALVRHETYWTPTIGALVRAANAAAMPDGIKDYINDLIDSHLAMIQYAKHIGVGLTIGTDCILPDPCYREAYYAELAYLVKAGLKHEDVMKIACDSGASLLEIKLN